MSRVLMGCLWVVVLACSEMTVGQQSEPCSRWDDTYQHAITELSRGIDPADANTMRERLRGGMWNWSQVPDRAAAKRLVEERAGAVREMIRLEIGSESWGYYKVVWVTVTPTNEVWLVTDERKKLESIRLPPESWTALARQLNDLEIWTLRSDGDLRVDDGSTYYVTACLGGRLTQFAVYALFTTVPEQGKVDTFVSRVERHRATVDAILDLLSVAGLKQDGDGKK